eukprot:Phypoly_transcript_06598.p1 GENE.Phypoly_transcript_06598~~Phypoly_transcript_06598.p1  ORF type:complete len:498 (+),score=103.80 Phypoly_transcript_06598:150-1643(+)
MEEAKVDPRRCIVDLSHFGEDNGSGSSSFSFTSRDRNGDIISPTNNAVFGAKIMNQQDGIEHDVIIKKTKDEGFYEVLFAPLPHGVYLVVLGLLTPNGTIIQEMVKGSPFTVRVGPNPDQDRRIEPEPSRCYIFGPGAKKTAVKRKTSFVLQACGHDGSKVKNGGDPFKVKVVPPSGGKLSSLPSSILDQKDGTYTVSFTPTVPGDHVVHLTLTNEEDVEISNSPFSIPVLETIDNGEEVSPARTVIDLEHAVPLTNNVFGFPIAAKNGNGQSMHFSLQFRARITGPEGLDVQNKVVECENGSFLLKFFPKQSGTHDFDVDVCINGSDHYVPVTGSPAILDLELTFEEAKIESLDVLSKVPREKVYDPNDKFSPKSESKTTDSIPPKFSLARESGAINRTPPPQWVPQSSAAKAPVIPPKNPLMHAKDRRSFSSPTPVLVSVLKSHSATSISTHTSAPSSPLSSKPNVPPKNPAGSPLSLNSSPPAWFVSKTPAQKN